jgi:hypothetical protein
MFAMTSIEEATVDYRQLKKRRKWPVIAGAIVFALALLTMTACYGYGAYTKRQFVNQVPASIRKQVTFPIYLPKDKKTEVKPESIMYSNSVFQYTAVADGVSILVSQQAKTKEFELSKFATSDSLTGSSQTTIGIGSQLTGSLRGRYISIIDTGDTIITTTSIDSNPKAKSALDSLARSLTKL